MTRKQRKQAQMAARVATSAPTLAADSRPSMKVSYSALATMQLPDGKPVETYKLPEPAPGVMPKAIKIAMDSAFHPVADFAQVNAIFNEGIQFMGYPYLAELTQRPEYRRPAEIFAKQMTRKWIELQATGDDGKADKSKADKIKAIDAEMKRLGVQAKFREAILQDGQFGRSHIYIDTGVDFNDEAELKTDLAETKAKVGLNSIKALKVIEPIWVYPYIYNSTNPLDQWFYKPQAWFVMNRTIHSSRLLTFVSREVPDILKPAYQFGGLSLSQMMKPYVDNWLRTRQSVSDIIHAFTVWVLKTNMSSILNGGGAEEFYRRLQIFNRGRDNHGVMGIDKETEDFANVSAPINGLDKLQAQAQEQMASVTGTPLVYLTGITPSGLNASSDGEIRVFEDWCSAQQEGYTPHVSRIINLIQLSLYGEIDPSIGFRWMPLHTQSENDLATARKQDADTDAVLIGAGVITQEEARARVAGQEDSPYSGLDLSEPLPEVPEPEEGPEAKAEKISGTQEQPEETAEA
jgi:phage-related protein (TIGR01555 family)